MADASFTNLRVLVVEDEFLVAVLIEDYLRELGCNIVGPAARLASAQMLVDQAAFDCALLDINVAGEKIYPIAAALAERGVPFAFLTGYDHADLANGFR